MSLQQTLNTRGCIILDQAIDKITDGKADATRKLRDIYILLHNAESKIRNAQHRHSLLPMAATATPAPKELGEAFEIAVDSMKVLQWRMWDLRYPLKLEGRDMMEVQAMFGMDF